MNLPTITTPARIARLPQARGYYVPWFVAWIDGQPEFRVADPEKFAMAIKQRLCWICGGKLGAHLAFVIGPMCAINRTSADPPSHRECAEYAVKVCPFLTKPDFERRECGMPENVEEAAGHMIKRNPGVSLIWITKNYRVFQAGKGLLFRIGEPLETLWYREGRTATRAEIDESIETGLPLLREVAEKDGPEDLAELDRLVSNLERILPCAV